MGSSLGGTLAILAAARLAERVDRVVLLAPAVMFAKPGHHLLPPERIEEWRRRGSLPFFHYAYGEERPLNVGFYEDTLRVSMHFRRPFTQPTLVFQGLHDRSGGSPDGGAVCSRAAERDVLAAGRRSPAHREPATDVGEHCAIPGPGRMRRAADARSRVRHVRHLGRR